MSPESQPTLTPQVVVGVVLALLGVIFTLNNLGLADTELVFRYWPVAVMAVGVAICMQAAHTREWIFGVVWMVGGAVLLAWNLSWITLHPKKLLPLLLVALGARLIWRGPPKSTAASVLPPPIPVTDVELDPGTAGPDAGWPDPSWQGPSAPAPGGHATSAGGPAAFTGGSTGSSGLELAVLEDRPHHHVRDSERSRAQDPIGGLHRRRAHGHHGRLRARPA